ncbi:NAD(P)/FAD-dependent oxidoreductase [Streptomyces sp. NPDC013978]|uniref:NAD(P)/FAD-dependent oxidoreductase n=1 Tax=Streptomyces sp. NPDC013978 TaxID=3364869 RepID=UPI0036FC9C8A
MERWCDGSLEIVPVAGEIDARKAINRMQSTQDRLAIVLSDEIGGVSLLQYIHMSHANTQLALLDSEKGRRNDYIVQLDMSPDALEVALEELFFAWNPPNPRVRVTGPPGEREGHFLRRFLYLNGIPYAWLDITQSEEITVYVDGATIPHPTPSQLYAALGIIPAPKHSLKYPYDLVVVGGGPAGLSAALSASLVGFSTLVIEAQRPGGTATASINLIRNYLGFPGGVAGTRLAKLALEQLATLEIDWRSSHSAHALRQTGDGRYEIRVGKHPDDVVSAGMVLLACGQIPDRLPLGEAQWTEERLLNRGVYYGAEPSDRLVELGRDVVVVGGGDSAGQAALMFAKGGSKSVALVAHEGPTMSKTLWDEVKDYAPGLIQTYWGNITEFSGTDSLNKVLVKGRWYDVPISATSAYINIGGTPNTTWLDDSGIELGDGYIRTDIYLADSLRQQEALPFETSLPGVFAAGDVRVNSSRRVGQAVGQGTAAVASMERYIRKNPQVLADPESTAHLLLDIEDFDNPLGRRGFKQWLLRLLSQ